MTTTDELLELEAAGWEALSTGGDAAATYYDEVLAREVLMQLPGGMVLDDRQAVIDSMRGDPWSSYELSDQRVIELSENCAVAGAHLSGERRARRWSILPVLSVHRPSRIPTARTVRSTDRPGL